MNTVERKPRARITQANTFRAMKFMDENKATLESLPVQKVVDEVAAHGITITVEQCYTLRRSMGWKSLKAHKPPLEERVAQLETELADIKRQLGIQTA